MLKSFHPLEWSSTFSFLKWNPAALADPPKDDPLHCPQLADTALDDYG